ncbi:MAG: 30S ribosomal protein S1 [Candidatus Omnitrophica bacterium]|nr:30S ribosomal protein S1 [Candidatus Omnitrophota bacterium]
MFGRKKKKDDEAKKEEVSITPPPEERDIKEEEVKPVDDKEKGPVAEEVIAESPKVATVKDDADTKKEEAEPQPKPKSQRKKDTAPTMSELDEEDAEGKKDKSEQLQKFYYDTLRDLEEGQIVKGKIIDIRTSEVIVDIGYKSEGAIPLFEFSTEADKLEIGDEVEVLLESVENDDGMVVLSKQKAQRLQGWERVISTYGEGDAVEGKVSRKVKGGFMVNIGVEAFLPASQASFREFADLAKVMGQAFQFKILKINKPRKNIVVSRKEYLQKQREENRGKLVGEMEKGKMVKGVVKNITDFGAFIDLGGIDGLLHITDMSWGRVSHPSEILAIGDDVDIMVLDFDKEKMRVSLGLKQKTENPWLTVDAKYPVGSKIKGKVVNLMPYGAFIELEKGVEGLAHISELSWTKRIANPSDIFAMGDVIEAIVLDIDKANHKISLGIKQLESDPWQGAETKYSVDTKVKGKVRNLTDYGAFVELEAGIDGLVHVSDISWTRRINHPKEVLKKGQKIDAVILSVDAQNRKIALGLKQLMRDPWEDLAKRYLPDMAIDGTITKVTNFGVFVELEKDLEGLVHISELKKDDNTKVEDIYKVGDPIKVKVLRVDTEQRKIALSATSV